MTEREFKFYPPRAGGGVSDSSHWFFVTNRQFPLDAGPGRPYTCHMTTTMTNQALARKLAAQIETVVGRWHDEKISGLRRARDVARVWRAAAIEGVVDEVAMHLRNDFGGDLPSELRAQKFPPTDAGRALYRSQ